VQGVTKSGAKLPPCQGPERRQTLAGEVGCHANWRQEKRGGHARKLWYDGPTLRGGEKGGGKFGVKGKPSTSEQAAGKRC